jgi:hypothetical protein
MVSLLKYFAFTSIFCAFALAQANLPSGTTATGYINFKNIATPATPASGKINFYAHSTFKVPCGINDAGTISCAVIQDTSSTVHQFITAIIGGVISRAQPAFSDLSSVLGCSQLPTFTGDVVNTACAMTVQALHLSVTPTLCSSGNYARGIDANGNATGCTAAGGGGGSTNAIGYAGLYCGGVTFSCASRTNVIANTLIIGLCSYYTGAGAGVPSFSDTLGLTWHQIDTAFASGNSVGVASWWANPGASTGADTFTCGNSIGISSGGMSVSFVIGATLASPIDVHTTSQGLGVGVNISLTTTGSDELLFMVRENSSLGGLVPPDTSGYTAGGIYSMIFSNTNHTSAFRRSGAAGTYYLQTNENSQYYAISYFAVH